MMILDSCRFTHLCDGCGAVDNKAGHCHYCDRALRPASQDEIAELLCGPIVPEKECFHCRQAGGVREGELGEHPHPYPEPDEAVYWTQFSCDLCGCFFMEEYSQDHQLIGTC